MHPHYCLHMDGLIAPILQYPSGLLFKEIHCKIILESELFCNDIGVRTENDFFKVIIMIGNILKSNCYI